MTRTHTFTLFFSGVDLSAPGVEDQLFEAGCDDAMFGTRGAIPYADFDREAPSFVKAVISAMSDLENAIPGLSVVRIEPDDLVSIASIAERTGRTNESVRLLIEGRRGRGGFPGPVAVVDKRTRLWSWIEVADWFAASPSNTRRRTAQATGEESEPNGESARFVAAMNGLLRSRGLASGITALEQRSALARVAEDQAIALTRRILVKDAAG
jgi:hypothetical protein